MTSQADTPKDAALRMIGRTIVNFQRLEHNLKLAARLGPLQGTIHKIHRDIVKRQERAATFTLGQAIKAWSDNFCEPQVICPVTPDLFDVSLQITFGFEPDPESQSSRAKALLDLLKVRNDLVHSRLAKFDWETPSACQDLVVELDKVNDSISEQIGYIHSLLKAISEASEEIAEWSAGVIEANLSRQGGDA